MGLNEKNNEMKNAASIFLENIEKMEKAIKNTIDDSVDNSNGVTTTEICCALLNVMRFFNKIELTNRISKSENV